MAQEQAKAIKGIGTSRIKDADGNVTEQIFQVEIDETAGKVKLVFDLEGAESKSGKTILLASSHGYISTDCDFHGNLVDVNVNVAVTNPEYIEPDKDEAVLKAEYALQLAKLQAKAKQRKS
jgi:hypothetical protein